jgi:hypothetical protein
VGTGRPSLPRAAGLSLGTGEVQLEEHFVGRAVGRDVTAADGVAKAREIPRELVATISNVQHLATDLFDGQSDPTVNL